MPPKIRTYIEIAMFLMVVLPMGVATINMWDRINEIYTNDKARAIRAVERNVCRALASDSAHSILDITYDDYRDVTGYDYNLRSMAPAQKCAVLGVDCVVCGTPE